MKKILVAAALAASTIGPAFASDKTDVLVPLTQFMTSFNHGDWQAMLAACTETTAIVDNFPPHEWHGAGACERWATGLQEFLKAGEIVDGKVTLLKPKHVDITGDRAYVVVPAKFSFKLKGKTVAQPGQLTVALVKGGSGWQMTGWAWADQ